MPCNLVTNRTKQRQLTEGEAHLVMAKPYPTRELFWNRQNISQHVDLEFIEVLIDRRLEKRFKLMESLLNLLLCFGIV